MRPSRGGPRAIAPRRAVLLVGVAIAAVAFVVFSVDAVRATSSGWEREVFRAVYDGHSEWPGGDAPRDDPLFDELQTLFSFARDQRTLAVLALAASALAALRFGVRGALFSVGSFAIVAVNPVLKELYARPAPFPVAGDYAYPSGHAVGSMVIAAVAVASTYDTRWRWVVLASGAGLLFSVGVPSVADGGHWPTDVLGGWILAAAWVVLVHRLVRPAPTPAPAWSPRACMSGLRARRSPRGSRAS